MPGRLTLGRLHQEILGCRRCLEAGLLPRAVPIVPAPIPSRIVLVGQAPGRVEEDAGRPFSGRAGRQLFRWLAEAGFGDEESARRTVYLTSITKCYPGPALSGSGDRRPGPREVELCRGHLERQLALLRPWLILAVGQMAAEQFLGPRAMHRTVGRVFSSSGVELALAQGRPARGWPLVLPLPHPSGASRWLNLAEHRGLLAQALAVLRLLAAPDPG